MIDSDEISAPASQLERWQMASSVIIIIAIMAMLLTCAQPGMTTRALKAAYGVPNSRASCIP